MREPDEVARLRPALIALLERLVALIDANPTPDGVRLFVHEFLLWIPEKRLMPATSDDEDFLFEEALGVIGCAVELEHGRLKGLEQLGYLVTWPDGVRRMLERIQAEPDAADFPSYHDL